MRRRRRLIVGVCLGLIACACAGVWLFAPRPMMFRGHTDRVQLVTACPGGRRLASGSDDGTVKVWDVATRKERASLRRPDSYEAGWTLVFSPDGMTLAMTGDKSGEIRLWDVARSREPTVLTGHKGFVNDLAFSPDGCTLASAGSDRTLRLWDVPGRRQRMVQEGLNGPARCLAYCCGGQALASGGDQDGSIRLWDAADGLFRATLPGHASRTGYLAASPDGKTLASADRTGEVKLWDAASGEEKPLQPPPHLLGSGWPKYLGFSPDGQTLAALHAGNELDVWDVASGTNTASWDPTLSPTRARPPAPVRALLGIHPKLADLYTDLTEEKAGIPFSLTFAPGGKILAVGRDDRETSVVRMWEMHPIPRGK
jgi:WD40 repeat protein